ncbi:MAG TPA: hypothetical protein VGQ73_09135 [Gemmatimonadales bacterium]|nr:hypothetical protein [Gemmatimonadales bacterium]
MARGRRALDPALTTVKILDVIGNRREDDVRKAMNATVRARPEQPLAFFVKCLGREVRAETMTPRAGVRPIRTSEDPY